MEIRSTPASRGSNSNGNGNGDDLGEVTVLHESSTLNEKLPKEFIQEWKKRPEFKYKFLDFMKFMLNQGINADVKFTLKLRQGPSSLNGHPEENPSVEVKAHKSMLKHRSEFFKTLFSERWMKEEIDLTKTNITAKDFKSFLEFVYIGQTQLTNENVLALYWAANFYDIVDLKTKCEVFVEDYMNLENIFTLFIPIFTFDIEKRSPLLAKIVEFIISKGSSILDHPEMLELTKDQLTFIFSWGKMECRHLQVLRFVLRWAEKKFGHQILLDHAECNKLLNELLVRRYHLTVPHLSCEEVNLGNNQDEFRVKRFYSMPSYEKNWSYRPKHVDQISFRVSQPIFLTGIGLFGDKNYHLRDHSSSDNEMRISYRQQSRGFYHVDVKIHVHGKRHQLLRSFYKRAGQDINTFTKTFRIDVEPCLMQPEEWYTISVEMMGQPSFSGENGYTDLLIMCNNIPVVVEFKEADTSRRGFDVLLTNATGVPVGQIPELYFKIADIGDDDDVEIIEQNEMSD